MKCPVCKTDSLQATTLDADLPAYCCATCSGIWLASNEYLAWLKTQPAPLPEKDADDTQASTWDVQVLKLCPTCGRILTRHRILPNVQFWLERCGHCNGVWFDKNEWDVLLAHNLQDKVNQFFTKPWQERLHHEETRAMLDHLYLQKFGASDYEKIKAIRDWLKEHPQQGMLLAYLQAHDPYEI